MENCIFCKIVKKEIHSKIVYEDKYSLAFLDVNPVNLGHTLVITKKHLETINEISDKELNELIKIVKKISDAILKNSEGLNVMQNNKKSAGQLVPHLHFHLIPRYFGDGHKFDWKTKKVSEEENKQFIEKIKRLLK